MTLTGLTPRKPNKAAIFPRASIPFPATGRIRDQKGSLSESGLYTRPYIKCGSLRQMKAMQQSLNGVSFLNLWKERFHFLPVWYARNFPPSCLFTVYNKGLGKGLCSQNFVIISLLMFWIKGGTFLCIRTGSFCFSLTQVVIVISLLRMWFLLGLLLSYSSFYNFFFRPLLNISRFLSKTSVKIITEVNSWTSKKQSINKGLRSCYLKKHKINKWQ